MSGPELNATLIAAAAAYILGATPFGYMAGKLRGIDIREHGSGNIGATNVIRVLGKEIGIPVFILDMCKGLVPVLIAKWWCGNHAVPTQWPAIAAAAGAVLGHNFTFWLRFRGGKGVATSAGALAGVLPLPLLAAVLIWLILFFITRYVAVASIGAAVTVPVAAGIQIAVTDGPSRGGLFGFALLIGLLAVWRHRSNIRRLLNGTENRFVPKSQRTAAASPEAPSDSPADR